MQTNLLLPHDSENQQLKKAEMLINRTFRSFVISGKAGTGKSTFLRYIMNNVYKKSVVVAPTGIAALNVEGVTIHSFFQLPPKPFLPNDVNYESENDAIMKHFKYSDAKKDLLRELELLIIDEVSMVRPDILDVIDKILRCVRKNHHLPFGGVQVLLIGDPFQLPPVIRDEEKKLLAEHFDTMCFFSADVLKSPKLINIELDKVYRQSNADFVALLSRIRTGNLLHGDIDRLNTRYQPNYEPEDDAFCIHLATTNKIADTINVKKLSQLPDEIKRYCGYVSGAFDVKDLPTDMELNMKINSQIMFVKNDPHQRWVNGTIGHVVFLEDSSIHVRLKNGEIHKVKQEKWIKNDFHFDAARRTIVKKEIGSFTQYPIKLAWAITIHKSQGMTFDRQIVYLGTGAFTAGQLYVCLSRCRTFEGIILKSRVKASDVIVNRDAHCLYENADTDSEIQRAIDQYKITDDIKYKKGRKRQNNPDGNVTGEIAVF